MLPSFRRVGLVVSFVLTSLLIVIPSPTAQARPTFTISTVQGGLKLPWDITWVGDLLLYNQRAGGIWSKRGSADPQRIDLPLPSLWVHGEAGLLGMVADPDPARRGVFYTCSSVAKPNGDPLDNRVLRWRLTSDTTAVPDASDPASANGAPVITGIPIDTNHNGCRLRFGPDGKQLYVSTGDGRVGTNPQSLASLGGKVLRVNPDGSIPSDNPYASRTDNGRYVFTRGHRNAQGLAFQPGTGALFNSEHGPDRDDEVNLNVSGGNYGWDPVPGYDQSVPMTDLSIPEVIRPIWKSGSPTVAPSGIDFFRGPGWGAWRGMLAVAMLKGQGIRLLYLKPDNTLASNGVIKETTSVGRIRGVQTGPDGSLYFWTSNGSNDVIKKMTPTATPPTVAAGQNIASTAVSAVLDGAKVSVFIRAKPNRIVYKTSTDDGRSWPKSWVETRVTSSMPPAVASSGPGKITLLTRNDAGTIVATTYVNGVAGDPLALPGPAITTATISSPGDDTLDASRWRAAVPCCGPLRRFLVDLAHAGRSRGDIRGRRLGQAWHRRRDPADRTRHERRGVRADGHRRQRRVRVVHLGRDALVRSSAG